MTKIAITADWQFDLYANLSTGVTSRGYTSRLQDQVDAWDWMVREASKAGCLQLFVLGDVFERRTAIDLPVLDAVHRCFKKAANIFDAVYVVPGNHDCYLRSPSVLSVAAYDGTVTLAAEPTPLSIDDAEIIMVPWAEGELFQEWVDAAAKRRAKRKYLFTHVLLAGLYPGAGYPAERLHPEAFRRVVLGDVHEPVAHPDHEHVHYCGAPMAFNYGDKGERGFGVLDVGKDAWTYMVNTVSPTFLTVRGDADRKLKPRKGDFVRLVDLTEDDAEAMRTAAKNAGAVLRDNTVSMDVGLLPRIAITTGDATKDILTKYLDYVGVAMDDRVKTLEAGLRIMKEAVQC